MFIYQSLRCLFSSHSMESSLNLIGFYYFRYVFIRLGNMKLLLVENVKVALESVRNHVLRTVLTVLIIAFGIMALVGILTAIDSIEYSINNNFSMMGANTFTIRNHSMQISMGERGDREYYKSITYREAIDFKERFDFPVLTSVSARGISAATVKYRHQKTNPNISVAGGDENYIICQGYQLGQGRNFTPAEVHTGANVAIIGNEIANRLFKNKRPVGERISVGPGQYTVIGVLKSKGSSFNFSGDRNVIIPVNNVRRVFSSGGKSYQINVKADSPEMMEAAIGEAKGLFRVIRGLNPREKNNFDIAKSDNLIKVLIDNIKYITLAATLIGLITLIGAAVGLMNIMIVSVTERTREIGIRKALGASRKIIRDQFLVEAVTISQLGGLLGIFLGIALGNITSLIFNSNFIIPWFWILSGIVLCIVVGLISGIYPAIKAARMEPIESLRYE